MSNTNAPVSEKKNDYNGKYFSVLGDSITTLEGYNPEGYRLYYCGKNLKRTGVFTAEDTWWGKVISALGGKLLINNSWSGSRVAKVPDSDRLFPSGCSDERTSALGKSGTDPDVILIYLGANDWEQGAPPYADKDSECDKAEVFAVAYDTMLKKLKESYPAAEIWCFTLAKADIKRNPFYVFRENVAGYSIKDYNAVIMTAAKENGCKAADLYSLGVAYDSVDGSHPTRRGMKTLADMMCSFMLPEAKICIKRGVFAQIGDFFRKLFA